MEITSHITVTMSNGNLAMLTIWDVVWVAMLAVLGGAVWAGWMTYISNKGVGPTRWPLVGMLPAILLNVHNVYDWITEIAANCDGSYQLYGPQFSNLNYFFTADPRNMEHVLRDNFANYPKGQDYKDILQDLLGHGIANTDGDMWRMQRKALSLQLNSDAHRHFSDAAILSAVSDKLLPVVEELCTRGRYVDLQDLMLRFTFDTICQVGFGIDTRCFTADFQEVPLANALEHALDCTMVRFFLPGTWWKLFRRLQIGKERGMLAALKVMDEFVTNLVSQRRKELAGANNDTDNDSAKVERFDLLSCFMKLEKDSAFNNDQLLKDGCINILLAGRDTSALALTWFFWLIATHLEQEVKLVEEIDATLGEANGVLSRETLNRMSYLHAALSETLRLYPSVPFDIKHIVQDDVLPDGHRVCKDHKLIFSRYTMGRMESIWGPDCREFCPERWFDVTNPGQLVHVSPFLYPAFNAGPRTCLGKDMSFLVMKAVACTLLHNFKIVLVRGHVVEPKLSVTLYMKHGLLISLQPRVRTKS